jgi:ketosteroid isomerase-like protein
MDPTSLMLTALRFNERINKQDAEGLARLMTDNHKFIDSAGNITKGKDAMKNGWKDFFKEYPDYRNILTCITVQDEVVVMVGHSTCSHKLLDGPNVWTAKISGKKVSEWRVQWLNQRQP